MIQKLLFKTVLSFLLGLLILLSCLFTVLISTEIGLRTSIKVINYTFFQNKLHINKIRGTLLGTVNLDAVSLKWHLNQLNAENIKIQLNLDKLFIGQLSLKQTTIKHLRLKKSGSLLLHLKQVTLQGVFNTLQDRGRLKGHIFNHGGITGYWTVTGNMQHYFIKINLSHLKLSNAIWHINGQGNKTGFYLRSMNDNVLGGQLNLRMTMHWLPDFNWQFSLLSHHIVLKTLNNRLPDRLSFLLTLQSQNNYLSAKLSQLKGQLNNQAISGYGFLTGDINKNDLNLDTNIHIGKTQIKLSGRVDQHWNLSWLVASPNIQTVWKGVSGGLNLQGTLTGLRQQPLIQSSIRADNLHINHSVLIQNAHAKLHLNWTPKGQVHLSGIMQDFYFKSLHVSKVGLDIQGTLDNHLGHLMLKMNLNNRKVEGAFQGKLNVLQKTWQVELDKLDILNTAINGKDNVEWQLAKKVLFTVTPDRLQMLSPLDWIRQSNKHENIQLLLGWNRLSGGYLKCVTTPIHLSEFYESFLQQPFLNHYFGGILAVNLQAHFPNDSPVSLDGVVDFKNGHVKLTRGKVKIKNINGHLKIVKNNFEYQIFTESGAGRMIIKGEGALASLFSKPDASSDMQQPTLLSQASIQANDFTIFNTNNLQLNVSSQLNVQIYPDAIQVKGSILIPSALIKPTNFSNVHVLSKDVVFVNKNDKDSPRKLLHLNQLSHKFHFTFDVKLLLGKNIAINFKGLEGQLIGSLHIIKKIDQPIKANGKLEIVDGIYSAYGENLPISEGQLNFVDSDLNNPILNIKASRSFESTNKLMNFTQQGSLTVGVRVSGHLKHLRTYLFSDPAGRSQSDILSLLIFGQNSVDINDDNEKTVLLKAATALNFGSKHQGLGAVINQLRNKLGLAELGVESESQISESSNNPVFQNTSLVLGKYLSPQLYIKYSYGLLEPINTLSIRYSLGKHLKIQTQTSEEGNGVDMLYIFDHK